MKVKLKPRKNRRAPEFQAILDAKNYTITPNKLMDRVIIDSRSGLTKNERIVLQSMVRQTLGWQVVKARVATGTIAKKTHIFPRRVREALQELERRQLIVMLAPYQRYPRVPKLWELNLRAEEWLLGGLPGDEFPQGTNSTNSQGTDSASAQGTNRRRYKDRDKDSSSKYSRPADKEADYLKRLLNDNARYVGLNVSTNGERR